MDYRSGSFIWDLNKEAQNIKKHTFNFITASKVFFDSKRIITTDEKHSKDENRYFCIGKVKGRIITVRFTYQKNLIRIYGAGSWRKGVALYEKTNG